ncbi:MAG: hypothetical protein PHY40_01490 [Patescibacteria group bacterium]|nr:hypothetical protein [Patescibacteria group bacterium]
MKEKRIKEIKLFLLEKMLYLFSSKKTIDELKEFFLKGYEKDNIVLKVRGATYGYGCQIDEVNILNLCLVETQIFDNLSGGFTIKISYSGLFEKEKINEIIKPINFFTSSMNQITKKFISVVLKEEQPLRVAPDGSLRPSQPFLFLS